MTNYSHVENAAAIATTFKMQKQKIIENFVEEQFQGICGGKVIY